MRTAAVGLAARLAPEPASADVWRFRLDWRTADIDDLRRRLRRTRFPDAVTDDWSMGVPLSFLRRLVTTWADAYPFEDRLARLNRLPHHRVCVGGFGVHVLHFRSPAAEAIPLLLMNGWPSSFVEYGRIVPKLLAGPRPFHVVIPALPGFGYSDRPSRPYAQEPADLFPRVMTALGYERFLAAGTDIGAGVATRIALRHPHRVLGVHVSAVAERPSRPGDPAMTEAERAYRVADDAWTAEEGGYQAIQSSRPQTLAIGLSDSPAGLAAWITEKFRAWSDCGGDVLSVFPMAMLLDNLTIYWMSRTAASSMRYYFEARRLRPPLRPDDFVRAPTAIAVWPHDLAQPPVELARRLYHVTRYTVFPVGGHFPAWEVPALYAADLRAFATDSRRPLHL